MVVGVCSTCHDGERAERIVDAILARKLVETFGGVVNELLNH